jgi:purine-binding chemotaxis protein CheW
MKGVKTDVVKLVTFQLGVDLFAADVFSVERVLRYTPPSSVPDVPSWIEGVLDYHGRVVPVVDMRRRIELADSEVTPETRTLVLTTTDGPVGAIVDAVHEVAVVPVSAVAPPPKMFKGLKSEFVRGIAKVRDQLVVVLEVERVLTSADRIAFEQAIKQVEVAARG